MLTGLSALEQTDWTRLHHAYGRAADTPAHLRALLEDDPAGRRRAMEHLWSAIIHQGTPWTATGPAARVVAGLLVDDDRIDRGPEPIRANLLSFLVEVAQAVHAAGQSVAELQETAAGVPNLDDLIAAGDEETLYGDEVVSSAFFARGVLGCAQAAPAMMAAMRAGLAHDQARVRVRAAMGAAALASHIPEQAGDVRSRLAAMIRASSDSDERAALVLALGELDGDAVRDSLSDRSHAVRVCAALAPGLRNDAGATAVLLDAFNNHVTEIDGWFTNRPPQFFGYARFDVVGRLVEVVSDFEQLLPGALALLPIADKRTVDRDWGKLLIAAFPAGDGVVHTPAQGQFLQALVDQRKLWDPVYGNPIQWFRKAGLPYDRRACAAKLK